MNYKYFILASCYFYIHSSDFVNEIKLIDENQVVNFNDIKTVLDSSLDGDRDSVCSLLKFELRLMLFFLERVSIDLDCEDIVFPTTSIREGSTYIYKIRCMYNLCGQIIRFDSQNRESWIKDSCILIRDILDDMGMLLNDTSNVHDFLKNILKFFINTVPVYSHLPKNRNIEKFYNYFFYKKLTGVRYCLQPIYSETLNFGTPRDRLGWVNYDEISKNLHLIKDIR